MKGKEVGLLRWIYFGWPDHLPAGRFTLTKQEGMYRKTGTNTTKALSSAGLCGPGSGVGDAVMELGSP